MKVGDIGVIDLPVELHRDMDPRFLALNGAFCLIVKEGPVQGHDPGDFNFKGVEGNFCYALVGGKPRNVWKSFIRPCDMETAAITRYPQDDHRGQT
jgi:hypothetical protein